MVQISKTHKTPSLSKRNDIYYTYKLTLHKYHEQSIFICVLQCVRNYDNLKSPILLEILKYMYLQILFTT